MNLRVQYGSCICLERNHSAHTFLVVQTDKRGVALETSSKKEPKLLYYQDDQPCLQRLRLKRFRRKDSNECSKNSVEKEVGVTLYYKKLPLYDQRNKANVTMAHQNLRVMTDGYNSINLEPPHACYHIPIRSQFPQSQLYWIHKYIIRCEITVEETRSCGSRSPERFG